MIERYIAVGLCFLAGIFCVLVGIYIELTHSRMKIVKAIEARDTMMEL